MRTPAAILTAVALTWGASAMSGEEKSATPPAPEVVAGTNRFTIDLYRAAAGKPGNVFASPLNVSTALGMTALGAKGETAGQIAKTLHLPADAPPDALGALARTVREAVKTTGEDGAAASTANAGWMDESESILPGYIDRLRESFDAEPHRVDFRNSPDAARLTINRWVADQTRDKIRDLLKPEHVDSSTALVLTSAIYFKGYWASPFDPELTKDGAFHATEGPAPARLMYQSGRILYREDDEAQVVSLPYKDATLTMLVVLPKRADGLAALEAGITPEKIHGWAATARPREVNLTLPRFRSTAEIDLKDALSTLGMPDAFDPAKADFSGINGRRDLFLSAVVHKAFIEVEEEGTEAAAATAAVAVRASAIAAPPVEFRADRPFLYMVRDSRTGAILFIGRLEKP